MVGRGRAEFTGRMRMRVPGRREHRETFGPDRGEERVCARDIDSWHGQTEELVRGTETDDHGGPRMLVAGVAILGSVVTTMRVPSLHNGQRGSVRGTFGEVVELGERCPAMIAAAGCS